MGVFEDICNQTKMSVILAKGEFVSGEIDAQTYLERNNHRCDKNVHKMNPKTRKICPTRSSFPRICILN
jgi:hypothetical protein